MYKLDDKVIENCGNKAKYLSILHAKGYNIPSGVVIDFEEFKNIIKTQKLNFENIDKIEITDELVDRIFKILPEGKKYAIRSSANVEDARNISLAGKYATFLNVVKDKACFKDKIKSCFLSLYSADNLQFYRRNNIDISKIEMNVIIQEMIKSNVSGILFTVNPTDGKDTQIVIEFSKGYGNIIDGKTIPERIVYDWYDEKYIEEPKVNILGDNAIKQIVNISLNLQQEVGFPIDVEFGVYDSKLYIFQIRPITKVNYKDVYFRYTDVNSNNTSTLSEFMWSIEEKVCSSTLSSFVNMLKIIDQRDIPTPIAMKKFSRLYWNLSLLKTILENVPGYVERNLDENLGIRADYIDDGNVYINTKSGIFNILPNRSVIDIVKKQVINVDEFRNSKIKEIEELKAKMQNCKDAQDGVINALNLFYDIKSAYLWQSLITMMYKINMNKVLDGILSKSEIQNLFIAIDDKYENGPTLYMWDMTRKIRQDANKLKFFEENLDAEIFYLYRKDRNNESIKEFLTDFIDLYGYHGEDETDIIYKPYDEEILKVIKTYRDLLELDDRYDPLRSFKQQNKLYEEALLKIEDSAKKSQLKDILKKVNHVRELIKKKNALRDLVLMSRNVLRKYMLLLGKQYKDAFIIDSEDDLFHLNYKYALNRIEEESENIKAKINKNKAYYNSFRNYNPDVDIFPCSKQYIKMDYTKSFKGIGASFGKVNAKACIVNEKSDLKNLRKFDILVTKYIDQDIFKDLNIRDLSGIVTEYGGVLCHLAINARENRIPCVVSLQDATKNIKDGDNLLIDGDTGEVIIK